VNTFEGEVDLNAGILGINSRDSLGATDVILNVSGNSTLQAVASFISDQSIDLNANTLSVDTNGFIVELSGDIDGTGGIRKIGDNILTLSGEKKYTGLTEVVQGELIVKNTTTKVILGDYSVTAGAVLDLEQRFATLGDYTGVISGNGTLLINERDERGIVRLSGDSSPFNGSTEVRNGILDLSGTLGGNLQVFGILSGHGTSLGDVRIKNGGTIAPGIGTFTVTKNYFQEAGSTYLASFNLKDNSLIKVKQAAILEPGSSLGLLVRNGVRVNTRLTVLTAEGGLGGQFTNVFTDSDNLFGTAFYDANNVFVVIKQDFNIDAETCNQKEIAEQLNELGTDLIPELQAVLQEFSTLDAFAVRDALDQLSGVQFSNVLFAAELANRQFTRRIFDPLRILITANPCTPTVCCNYKPSFDLWAAITGGCSFIHGNRNTKGSCINKVKGFRISDYAITVGAHTKLLPQFIVGGAISYERDCISYNVGGTSKNDVVLLGGYALYRPPTWFYVLGDLIFGHNSNEIKRSINIGLLKFRPKSNVSVIQASIYGEIGVDVPLDIVLLQPFFAFESGTFRFNNFKESGGGTLEQPVNPLTLSIGGKTWTSAGTRLGVHLTSAPLLFGLSMGIDLSWNYRLTSQSNTINDSFQDFGTAFQIKGLSLQRNSFEGAIFLNQRINKMWSLYFEGNGLGWENSFSYSFTGGVVASF
jgi:autotransporter-associated beta strand protein